jgi:tryptophanyl-tRNA synthetase
MISATGYWNLDGSKFDKEHVYDPTLSQALIVLAKSKNISKTYDFGCGHGLYTADFISANIACKGFDGNPITATLPDCQVRDLTDSWQEPPVDFLLCLEVCEHVPKEYETALLNTLVRHVNPGGTLVISWAVPGQGGLGHVNCKTNKDVIDKMESLGFVYNKEESEFLRKSSKEPWFKNTILCFCAF